MGLFESNAHGITTHLMYEIPLLCEVFFKVRKTFGVGHTNIVISNILMVQICLFNSRKPFDLFETTSQTHTHCKLVHIRAAFFKPFWNINETQVKHFFRTILFYLYYICSMFWTYSSYFISIGNLKKQIHAIHSHHPLFAHLLAQSYLHTQWIWRSCISN